MHTLRLKYLIVICQLLLLTLLLSGCSLFRPTTPIASIAIQSVQYLNPDLNGRSAPVVVTFYQLKSRYAFEQASFADLFSNSAKTLGSDLLDKNTIEVRPNSQRQLKQTLAPSTRYLGVVASYRNIQQATWRKLIKIDTHKHQHTVIQLDLESQALVVHQHTSRFLF